jgi:integration host factor subunit alpha
MSTLTRASLAETIYAAVGLSRNESAVLLEAVLDRMKNALAQGESVKISGFGTFSVRQKGRRIGRNPKTGLEVPILPRRVLIFRPSQILRQEVTKGAMKSRDGQGHGNARHSGVQPGAARVSSS